MWHHPVFQGVLLKFFFSCQTWGHQVLLVLRPRFPTFQLSVLVSKTQNSHHLVKLQSSANGAPSKTRDILRGYTPTFITSSCDPRWDVQICPTKCQTFDISNTKSQLRSRSPKQHPNTYSRTVPRIIHFTEFQHFDWVFSFELRRERSLLSCQTQRWEFFRMMNCHDDDNKVSTKKNYRTSWYTCRIPTAPTGDSEERKRKMSLANIEKPILFVEVAQNLSHNESRDLVPEHDFHFTAPFHRNSSEKATNFHEVSSTRLYFRSPRTAFNVAPPAHTPPQWWAVNYEIFSEIATVTLRWASIRALKKNSATTLLPRHPLPINLYRRQNIPMAEGPGVG